MSSTPIIIISLSGRGLAQALNAAGFRVAVVDLFGDVDTQAFAERVIRIEAREGFRLDPEQTLGALQTLTAEGFGPRVIVGSGFEDALEHALTEVANLTGLRGCFSIDFIYGRDGVLWVVDVNPRPPATLALCADRAAVMQQHVAVCSGRRLLYSRPETTHCRAHWVVYSNAAWVVPDRFTWPDAVADIPRAGATVAAQHPLCTLETEARSDVEAMATLEWEFRNLAKALGRDADRVMGAKINIKRVGEE